MDKGYFRSLSCHSRFVAFSNMRTVEGFSESEGPLARTQEEGAPTAVRQGRGRSKRSHWPLNCQRVHVGGR
jgi:hypothetical protein